MALPGFAQSGKIPADHPVLDALSQLRDRVQEDLAAGRPHRAVVRSLLKKQRKGLPSLRP